VFYLLIDIYVSRFMFIKFSKLLFLLGLHRFCSSGRADNIAGQMLCVWCVKRGGTNHNSYTWSFVILHGDIPQQTSPASFSQTSPRDIPPDKSRTSPTRHSLRHFPTEISLSSLRQCGQLSVRVMGYLFYYRLTW